MAVKPLPVSLYQTISWMLDDSDIPGKSRRYFEVICTVFPLVRELTDDMGSILGHTRNQIGDNFRDTLIYI